MADLGVHGVRFHVQRLGEAGPVVVFLHGLVMDNLSSWYFTLAAPASRFARVVLYDLRGHGLSDRPASGYGLADHLADLGGVLDGLGVAEPVTLVGNSFGALLALAFAVRRPARVGRLVIVDGQTGAPGWGERMAATLSLEGIERDLRIAEAFKSWLGRHSQRKRTRLARAAESLVRGTSLVTDMRASPGLSDAELAGIGCPILAVYGEASEARADGERLARLAPRCELRRYPGCSHSVLWEATGRVRDEVLAWLGQGA